MKNKIVSALLGLCCVAACGTAEKSAPQPIPITQGTGTCLIDFVDPQDGESPGFLSDEAAEAEIKELAAKFDLAPAGLYSETNHLYQKTGACPLIESNLVENIEPSAMYHLPANELTLMEEYDHGLDSSAPTNDPLLEHQWNLHHIDAFDAWKNSKQGKGVVVAVIDTGVAYKEHEKVHALEDMNETDFTEGVSFTRRGLPDGLDDHAHGSHVAGTIAQSTNNGIGVAGVAPKATIMALKVLSASGSGTTADIANAIRYAADHGAHVINMSLGGPYPSDIMRDAVDYAHEKGVTVVCAAGNENSSRVGYPAGYEHCIAVSSTNKQKGRSWFSNYGKDIYVAAPGGDTRNHAYDGILQNTINPRNIKEQGYYGFQGTSMASPHAAAVAALIIGEGVTDNEEVWRILKESAVHPKDMERDDDYGFGIINANRAVLMARGQDGDEDGPPLRKYRWYIIGGVLFLVVVFVGFRGYQALKRVESDHRDFDDDEDLN